MNEQIKELAIEAKLMVSTYTGELTKSEQKFAELIVRECASIDFCHKIGLTSDQDYEVSNIIKEHFGVKE